MLLDAPALTTPADEGLQGLAAASPGALLLDAQAASEPPAISTLRGDVERLGDLGRSAESAELDESEGAFS